MRVWLFPKPIWRSWVTGNGFNENKQLRNFLSCLFLCCNRNLNNPIQLVLEEVVGRLDVRQLIAVGDQRCGINLACFDEGEDFRLGLVQKGEFSVFNLS